MEQDIDTKWLDDLSVRELRALKDAVDSAIRAAIARDRVARSVPEPSSQPVVDLERERDAWKAARKAG